MKIKKKYRGVSSHRYGREPLEKIFAEVWQERNDCAPSPSLLSLMMDYSSTGSGVEVTERDFLVANTVIQWLGSVEGQFFLNEVLNRGLARR